MPVVGSQLAKIGHQLHRNVKWIAEIILRIAGILGASKKNTQQQGTYEKGGASFFTHQGKKV
jgi:hypothetical protein